ncbi:hypothetical protein J1N35_014195 [Gossypium stocksii]|uniref:Uncharacterized protein n=1 Tax=Gossypium stocksii TaxID=47602 RepID=A0A9D3VWI0_9ROSI|nr:hypothetical protein J1N35_014195 [Gossypium stocksii]
MKKSALSCWAPEPDTVACPDGDLKFAGHVSMEYVALSVSGTGALGGLCTYWTCVWMACGVRGPFSEFFRCMQSEIALFPRFPRGRSVTLSCELDPRDGLRPCPVSSRKVPTS